MVGLYPITIDLPTGYTLIGGEDSNGFARIVGKEYHGERIGYFI